MTYTSNDVSLCSSLATPPDQTTPASPGLWSILCAERGTGTGGNQGGSSGKHEVASVGEHGERLLSQRQPSLMRSAPPYHLAAVAAGVRASSRHCDLQPADFSLREWHDREGALSSWNLSLHGEEPGWRHLSQQQDRQKWEEASATQHSQVTFLSSSQSRWRVEFLEICSYTDSRGEPPDDFSLLSFHPRTAWLVTSISQGDRKAFGVPFVTIPRRTCLHWGTQKSGPFGNAGSPLGLIHWEYVNFFLLLFLLVK